MNRVFFVIIILLCSSLLFSQELSEIRNEDLVTKSALVFNLDGFSLKTFDGGLGWKKWINENTTISGIVQIMVSKEKKEAGQELSGTENNRFDLQLSGGIEKRFPIRNRLSPYFGGRLGLGYDKIFNKINPSLRLIQSTFDIDYRSETKSTLFYFSVYFVVGVEYFFRSNLSLSGQYRVGGEYNFGEENNISTVVDEVRDISRLNLGVWSSSLILSIYF